MKPCLPTSALTRLTGAICRDKRIATVALAAVFGLAACSIPVDSGARVRMLRGHVVESVSTPCFSIDREPARSEDLPKIVFINVFRPQSAAMARDGEVFWQASFVSTPVTAAPGEDGCLRYGVAPAGSRQNVGARTLAHGVRYSFSINANPPGSGRRGVFRYSGDFCLGKDDDGSTRIHDLWLPRPPSLSKDDACYPLYLDKA